jgi:hypothetical protein
MPVLSTQTDLRAVQTLPFCYLCGNAFVEGIEKNRDHVPPKSIFAISDRDPPLTLPTHVKCNGDQSGYDEVVGQLIAAIHGKYPEPARTKLDVSVAESAATGTQSAWLSGANLHRTIGRWLRAFHAALYREFLPDNDGTEGGTKFSFDPPFPIGRIDESNEIIVAPISPHHTYCVEQIKRNRTAGRLDRITCFNGKCVYECVWDKADGGQPICIFALNVYDWSALANTDDFPKRGCVGMYLPAKGRPADGTTATRLVLPISNAEILDPFGR